VLAAVVGVGCAVAGWVGVSDATLTAEQLPYLASGAVGALFALGIAATLWLSADLRDEWSKLDELREAWEAERAARSRGPLRPGPP
jgi:hypothetical protein